MNNDEIKNKQDYWLNEYWPELQKATLDSEEKLEKYIFTISTGAVGIIMGTMGIQTESKDICLTLIALGSFTFSMLFCVIYHIIAKRNHTKQFKKIEEFVFFPDNGDSEIRKKIKNSNKLLAWTAIISVIFIFAGIVFYALSLIKNLS